MIDSRELADTKAAYLAARERVHPRRERPCARERPVGKENFPGEDYLKAKQALAEARIELQVRPEAAAPWALPKAYLQATRRPADAS